MQPNDFNAALLGEWQGTKQLYLEPPPAPPSSCASELSAKSIAGGSFLQFDYHWTFEGEQQTGILMIGSDEENAASAAWVDSFHMSKKVFVATGTAADGSLEVRGSYAAPPGPDWGWTIAVRSAGPTELQIVMHNISPEGEKDLAVQFDFTRAS
jgi:hypothetical protein